ncbi:pseudaminic acid synthase [Saccharobesus litoralis]|uniref:Pseudaminic acid synthase n=1 Tax=Saccharobesus litoralis TaxID=2172099 RepID=A0A2S0VUE7_9ALTE|nr:pseudaminic acid synthase [Saccharobesus litoralis]AWB67792.1 pseudaminic acid synthase [Saccharobesus litoralis]
MKIANRAIGPKHPPFVIAELSGNHSQDFALAKNMIKAAADAGVDAIKLQTYTADSMTLAIDSDNFRIMEPDSLWYGQHLHDLYGKACTPYEWHKPLFDYAQELGLIAFSSPFDEDAVDFLESLNVPAYKIASFELTDIPLITKVAATGKPMIMSTGMASEQEITDALTAARNAGAQEIVLLKCTSTYPANADNTNLVTIPDLQKKFNCLVGLSDHTRGIGVSVASVALGACVIEKHFVLDRNAGGVDAAFSLEPDEFKALVTASRDAHAAMGEVTYGGSQAEEKSKYYRRSIFVTQTIKAGEKFSRDNIKVVRPAIGLAPKHFKQVLGSVATTDLVAGDAIFSATVKDFNGE